MDTALDFVPIAGGVKDIYQGIRDGDGWQVALGAGSIVLDIFTLGSSSLVKGAVKTGIKQGIKAGANNTLKKIGSSLPRGGKTFKQFKASRGGGGLVGEIPLNNPHKYYGNSFPVNTEFSHRFITQRAQKKFNLPNWLVNNRLNVHKTNTLRHAQHDKFRHRFLPREIKDRLRRGDVQYNYV